ncbi:hypothetical protein [Xanthobacter wiegelii]|uniref:hypothetical protein n=1 Tax=Xanthobacter wiegelii TaxID=3119913 RepID=UPI00372D83F3
MDALLAARRAIVSSRRIASSATFALNSAEYRLLLGPSPSSSHQGDPNFAPCLDFVDHLIASWLQGLKDDKRFIVSAAAHAQKAADFLHGLQPMQAAAGDAA